MGVSVDLVLQQYEYTRWLNKDLNLLCPLLLEFGLHHHWRSIDGQTEKVVERNLVLYQIWCIFVPNLQWSHHILDRTAQQISSTSILEMLINR